MLLILFATASIQAQQLHRHRRLRRRTRRRTRPRLYRRVRLPVVAVDQYGHYDPAVVPDDILVLEMA